MSSYFQKLVPNFFSFHLFSQNLNCYSTRASFWKSISSCIILLPMWWCISNMEYIPQRIIPPAYFIYWFRKPIHNGFGRIASSFSCEVADKFCYCFFVCQILFFSDISWLLRWVISVGNKTESYIFSFSIL